MNIFKAVREFWEIGHPNKIRETPGFPGHDTRRLCLRLINEEVGELFAADRTNDLTEFADALADIIYVTVGAAIAHGIPLEEVFAEVQRTNMAKFPYGKVLRDPVSGKVMKPEDWQPPDIRKILMTAGLAKK